ncbi:MAG TPA: glycosyltransferase [Streptosporangiaceae bacterium]
MVSETELVSVIIPNYNGAKTLAACLDSVHEQTYRCLEVIVVDDASTDGSADIAKSHACTLIELPDNRGPAAARNRGIEASRGGILFFLDADVALAPDAVETAVRILREHPEYSGASGIYATTPLFDDGVIERYQSLHAHYWRRRNAGIVRAGYFSLGALRRSTVEDIGGFDESLRANNNEDTEYGFRMSLRHPVLLTTEISGRHDDDDRLLPLLRKNYRRASSLVPLFLDRSTPTKTREMAHRPSEIALAGLIPLSALAAIEFPPFLVLSGALLAGFAGVNAGLLAFVSRAAGRRFLPVFLLIHLVMNANIAAAAGVGVARWLVDHRFRAMYRGGRAAGGAVAVSGKG